MNQPMYLKPNLIIEPLINQWYAWSYLISPATAAMYIANSHIPIMESFIAAPQVHRDALKNPAMIGGPFINYDANKIEVIRELLATTKTQQAQMLTLVQGICDLEKLLAEHSHGESLEPLYDKIPAALQGYVELVQDSNNHPSIRFIEGLLYRSDYYNLENQSLNLYLGNPDTRSFVLSTPRLPDNNNLHLQIPFSDSRLDQLFRLRSSPLPYREIRDILAINHQQEELFRSFFTTTPPTLAPKYDGDRIRVRYFGHACVLIETQSITILCDPLVSYPHDSGIERYSYTELPEVIDYALITHNHQDHVMLETLLQLRHKIKTVVVPKSNKGVLIDPSLKLMLQQIGFEDVREIDDLEVINITDGYIAGVPFLGEHGDLNIAAKAAYLVNLKGRSLLCAADSNNIDNQLYSHLQQIFGDLDVLFIGMECDGAPYNWAYGALLTQQVPRKIAQTRRLDGSNSQRAIALVNQLNPQQVYVYAMGQEPWLTFITSIVYTPESTPILESNKLIDYCHSRGLISKRLFGCEEILLEPNTHKSTETRNFTSLHTDTVNKSNQNIMPSIQEFLAELQRLDIRVWLDDQSQEPKLRCNAPKGVLNAEIKEKLQKYKPDIISFLANASQSKVAIDWEQEAILDESIVPENIEITPPALLRRGLGRGLNIFLTGATGFVGAFLLNELLRKTSASIYCLVRAKNSDIAQERIKKALQSYQLWDTSLATRIIPVVGELAQPNLGLSSSQFQDLANRIDVIYHNGARVNHTEPYSRLKPSNVLGTQEILRLASLTKLKPVHFVSTISVFGNKNLAQPLLGERLGRGFHLVEEDDNLDNYVIPSAGYAQSKRVAEKLINEAKKRGIPINIYRIGAISGDSQTGVFNKDDFLYNSLLGYVQMGSIPEGTLPLRILPVDYVSQAIFTLSTQSQNQSFHLVQSQPIPSDVIFEQLQKMGYSIKKVPYEQWRNQLLEIASNSPEHILYPLVSLFPRHRPQNHQNIVPLEFSDRNTQKILNGILSPPPIDSNLIQTYLTYLVQTGHIKPSIKI
jgi:thioester reductase-like protein